MTTIETARVRSTGDEVRVIRYDRARLTTGLEIMTALERAGHFVIGTPAAFRWKSDKDKTFTTAPSDAVFLLSESGAVTAVLPQAYFNAHYRIQR